MAPFIGSEYDHNRGRLYFDSRARFGRQPDTIIFWYAMTPAGRISKFWATLRINSDRNISPAKKQEYTQEYKFPKLPKGYTWSAPLLYSGELWN